MSKEDNGGPAFPESFTFDTGPLIESADGMVVATNRGSLFQPGMTLRDYFAANALKEVLEQKDIHDGRQWKNAAWISYEIADAMLEARSK